MGDTRAGGVFPVTGPESERRGALLALWYTARTGVDMTRHTGRRHLSPAQPNDSAQPNEPAQPDRPGPLAADGSSGRVVL